VVSLPILIFAKIGEQEARSPWERSDWWLVKRALGGRKQGTREGARPRAPLAVGCLPKRVGTYDMSNHFNVR
jgi:hypothetical protein